ncbi:hypothetical protein LXL04_002942 [Taraxacum kok-saghyz]
MSPTLQVVTPGPTAVTTPAPSMSGINGRGSNITLKECVTVFSFLKKYDTNDWLKMCYTVTHSFSVLKLFIISHRQLIELATMESVRGVNVPMYTTLRRTTVIVSTYTTGDEWMVLDIGPNSAKTLNDVTNLKTLRSVGLLKTEIDKNKEPKQWSQRRLYKEHDSHKENR